MTPPLSDQSDTRSVELTRDETRRLAGSLREGAEWIEDYEARCSAADPARLAEANAMHTRATELFDIAERIR